MLLCLLPLSFGNRTLRKNKKILYFQRISEQLFSCIEVNKIFQMLFSNKGKFFLLIKTLVKHAQVQFSGKTNSSHSDKKNKETSTFLIQIRNVVRILLNAPPGNWKKAQVMINFFRSLSKNWKENTYDLPVLPLLRKKATEITLGKVNAIRSLTREVEVGNGNARRMVGIKNKRQRINLWWPHRAIKNQIFRSRGS